MSDFYFVFNEKLSVGYKLNFENKKTFLKNICGRSRIFEV